jgi:DNA-binding NarL/FixJ family response regulator
MTSQQPRRRIRVLVADDHPIVREGLRAVVDTLPDMEFLGSVATGPEAVETALTERPDVVVMDLALPGIDGVEATRQIVAALPDVVVLVLTMHDDDTMLFGAIRAGARGYLVKGATQERIASAIRAVSHGEVLFGAGIAQRLLNDLSRRVPVPLPDLSEREREILRLLSSGQRTDQIAARLFLSPKTVRNHISNLMAKLGVNDRAQAVALARDAGITS